MPLLLTGAFEFACILGCFAAPVLGFGAALAVPAAWPVARALKHLGESERRVY